MPRTERTMFADSSDTAIAMWLMVEMQQRDQVSTAPSTEFSEPSNQNATDSPVHGVAADDRRADHADRGFRSRSPPLMERTQRADGRDLRQ